MTETPPVPAKDQGLGSPPRAEATPLHMIPDDILQRWSDLPANHPVTVGVTKQDLDNLFFAISNVHMALDTTNRAFVQWSNRQVVEAQVGLEASRQGLVAGMNSLRLFFEAMISRVVGQSANG